MADLPLPFEGIRVLDFTQLEQGPSGTLMLADFGAEVIKIERIDGGEMGRGQTPRLNGMSCHWSANNRNKSSLSVDLKHPRGKEIVFALVRNADIVASNFRPGVMDRLGLGFDDLRAVNPRIICAYASGYGQSGPYRHRRGQDFAAQALGGLMDLTGDADGPPTPVGTYVIDYVAAMQFAIGMMAALAARERTGEGQVVDTCLLNAAVTLHHQEATAFLNVDQRYPRPANGIAHAHNTPLYARYQARDGRWVALIGEFYVTEPWKRVTRALGLGDAIAENPMYGTVDGLHLHADTAHAILVEGFGRYERDEVLRRFEELDVLCVPVNDYPDVFADPQVRHNGMVIDATHPAVGEFKLVGFPIKLSATPARVRRAPPTVGEDNDAVLLSIGYAPAEIGALRDAGVIGSELPRQRAGGPPAWGESENAV